MDIKTREERDVVVVSVTGRMDELTAPTFEEAVREHIAQRKTKFIVDLGELEYISSAGLRSILAVTKMLKERDGRIVLTGLSGAVKEVFEITQFISFFATYGTPEEALTEL
jgi:anti-anti-sigma factor